MNGLSDKVAPLNIRLFDVLPDQLICVLNSLLCGPAATPPPSVSARYATTAVQLYPSESFE